MIRGPLRYAIREWDYLGLKILPQRGVGSIAIAVVFGLAFGAYLASADAFIFRAFIPAWQTEMVTGTSSVRRIAFFAPLAVLDEIEFRLLLMSTLVWLLTCRSRFSGPASSEQHFRVWTAIIAVAAVYLPLHPSYVASLGPLSPVVVAREFALHISAGILWGYLYWRYGLVSAIAGHVAAHVTLQPMLGYFFG
jgi:Type II CAAX prenyl endopeptidase Rce1-like